MKIVNMHEAKTTLSQLVEEAERGEDIVLARAGKPVAKIVALPSQGKRKLGIWRGRVHIPAGFDEPLPEDPTSWDGAAAVEVKDGGR